MGENPHDRERPPARAEAEARNSRRFLAPPAAAGRGHAPCFPSRGQLTGSEGTFVAPPGLRSLVRGPGGGGASRRRVAQGTNAVLSGSSLTAVARVVGWLVLVGIGAFGRSVPLGTYVVATVAAAMLVGGLSLAATFTAMWRGPPVITFAPSDSLLCGAEDSEPVRAYAQLRGTIGGAGHVQPRRLVLPLVAWGAALLAGARALWWPDLEALGAIPAALAVSGAFASWLFPATPYWYREVMGGGAIVSPPEAVAALVVRERQENGAALAAIRAQGRADPLLCTPAPRALTPATPAGAARPRAEGAAGEHAGPRARPPRYAVEQRIIVQQDGVELEVATVNVSEGGLAVHWPGELPVVGDDVVVKVEDGYFLRELEAEVRWNGGAPEADRMVGLRVAVDGRARRAWERLVQRASTSSAPQA